MVKVGDSGVREEERCGGSGRGRAIVAIERLSEAERGRKIEAVGFAISQQVEIVWRIGREQHQHQRQDQFQLDRD